MIKIISKEFTKAGSPYFRCRENDRLRNIGTKKIIDYINKGKVCNASLTTSSDGSIDILVDYSNTEYCNEITDSRQCEVMRLKTLMGNTIEADTPCKHKVYLTLVDNKGLMYVPDDVTHIDITIGKWLGGQGRCTELKVCGGKGLVSTEAMFYTCKFNILDISELNTSKVTNMSWMFAGCKANRFKHNMNTGAARNMFRMFFGSELHSQGAPVGTLDLSTFDTSKVSNMGGMFESCKNLHIILESFRTNNLHTARRMFAHVNNLLELDLNNFDFSKTTNMANMFTLSTVNTIDMKCTLGSKPVNFTGMFMLCKAEKVDLTEMRIPDGSHVKRMFDHNDIDCIITDNGRIKELCEFDSAHRR